MCTVHAYRQMLEQCPSKSSLSELSATGISESFKSPMARPTISISWMW